MESTYLSQETNKNSFKVKENDKDFRLEQDVGAYKEYASKQREAETILGSNGRTYRSFAIIPDIVAIDILTKYKLDVHAPDFMSNPANLRKLKQVIESDYPLLKTSNVRAL
jgi:hypothetical protein